MDGIAPANRGPAKLIISVVAMLCLAAVIGSALVSSVQAQVSVSNLLEYRLGNLPDTEPSNLTTFYDQLDIYYRTGGLTGHVKLEQFQGIDDDISFSEMVQRSLKFESRGFEIEVGNFNEMLGRGLLFRSYELPGVVLEDLGFRTRYGAYRDMEGVALRYSGPWIELKAIRGKPLRNDLPPGLGFDAFRRSTTIEAVQVDLVAIDGFDLGGVYMRDNPETGTMGEQEFVEYGSLFLEGNLPRDIHFYTEYASSGGSEFSFFDLSDDSPHALYSGADVSMGPVGLSLEYKDYNDFLLGYNDPPTLIREHFYVLLNRSSHLLIPVNESGWQAEAFYTSDSGHNVTINLTEARNKLFKEYLYKEFFLEAQYLISEELSIKGFFDSSEEPLSQEFDRLAGGLNVEAEGPGQWAGILDLEYQAFDRVLGPDEQKVKNYVARVTLTRSPDLSAGLIWERSTDPFETDDPATPVRETESRNWVGASVGYQYDKNHIISIFYGKRRGGPACESGICYQVLDFEGLELRINSTF
ncbi:MAG: hypothetical protein KOO63_01360 [Bacteroidales bacterium]|nr:hypothetical protein [Candidatus Latescibacterota bacterium]